MAEPTVAPENIGPLFLEGGDLINYNEHVLWLRIRSQEQQIAKLKTIIEEGMDSGKGKAGRFGKQDGLCSRCRAQLAQWHCESGVKGHTPSDFV